MEWKNNLQEFSAAPPEQSWNNIQRRLPASPKGRLKLFNNPYPSIAIAACATGIIFLGIQFLPDQYFTGLHIRTSVNQSKINTTVPKSEKKQASSAGSSLNDGLMTIVLPNGDSTKVSEKLKGFIPEIYRQKGNRVTPWQQKMATSNFIPRGDHFFDITEMVRTIQENEH